MKRMKITFCRLALLAGMALLTVSPLQALAQWQKPLPERLVSADVVLVGKVTAIEDKTVNLPFNPNGLNTPNGVNNVEFQVAVVKVEDPLLNAKGLKEVRVGFYFPVPPRNPPGRGGRFPKFDKMEVDQECCLLLTKRKAGDLYTFDEYNLLDKKTTTYEKDLELVKKATKLLADPRASLESKDANDRFLIAGMLIIRYCRFNGFAPKTKPIDATESKLILNALIDAPAPKPDGTIQMTPQRAFSMLGLKPADGWNPKDVMTDYDAAMKQWLKDNADKYRIRRAIVETNDKMPEAK